jgi:hypothetical protein
MKVKQTIRIGRVVIPAGTTLRFSNEGLCFYKGKALSLKALPGLEMDDDDEVKKEKDESPLQIQIKRSAISHISNLTAIGITPDDVHEDGNVVTIKFNRMPSTKLAKLLCNWLVGEAGYDVHTLVLYQPELAIAAKLVDTDKLDTMSNYDRKQFDIYNSGSARYPANGITD